MRSRMIWIPRKKDISLKSVILIYLVISAFSAPISNKLGPKTSRSSICAQIIMLVDLL